MKLYEETLSNFFDNNTFKYLIDHFPKSVNRNEFIHMFSSPPPCSIKHKSFSGELYLIKKINSNQKLDSLINISIAKYNYNDEKNFKIDFLKFERQENDICNKYFPKKYPMPCLETYNFEMGVLKNKNENRYIIPNDLVVYIIDAKNTAICKVVNIGKRPKSLKDWKRGFSKGIAISKKEKIVVYWTLIW